MASAGPEPDPLPPTDEKATSCLLVSGVLPHCSLETLVPLLPFELPRATAPNASPPPKAATGARGAGLSGVNDLFLWRGDSTPMGPAAAYDTLLLADIPLKTSWRSHVTQVLYSIYELQHYL